MLAFIIIIVETLFVFAVFLLTKRLYSGYSNKARLIFSVISLVIFHSGIVLLFVSSKKLNSFSDYKSWGKIDGTILSSKVIGDRAFRPDIEYEYHINGTRYTGISFLNVPGFGGRTNRRDAAEKIVKLFEVGKNLPVYFNPKKPEDSLLKINPPYSVYLQLAFGATLFAVFLYFTLIFSFLKRKS
jgi:hypothetical protein